jgi:hypothetical protein
MYTHKFNAGSHDTFKNDRMFRFPTNTPSDKYPIPRMSSECLFQLDQCPGHILSIKIESDIIEATGLIGRGLGPILGDYVGDWVAG